MQAFTPALAAALCLAPAFAAAQAIRDCNTWEANARNVMMPPDRAIRSFAGGEIRVIGLDTAEPACCSAHLMVDYFVVDEPFPHCALVSGGESMGFSGLRIEELSAVEEASGRVVLTMPAGRFDGIGSVMSTLTIVVDPVAATVTATHD